MAVQNPPVFLQAGSHPAEDTRRILLRGAPGPLGSGDLLVTEKVGTPDMSVDIAAGRALVAGSEALFQGNYGVESRSVENRAVATSDPANARIDLVVARVSDATYSGAVNAWDLEVVTGVAAPTPTEPTPPANSLVLARIDVGAGATSVTDADLTDRRVFPGRSAATLRFTTFNVTGSEADLLVAPAYTPPDAGRRTRVSLVWPKMTGTVGDILTIRFKESATQYQQLDLTATVGGGVHHLGGSAFVYIDSLTAAAHTFKATAQRTSGAGAMAVQAAANAPIQLLVEDLGPA